MGAPSGAVGAGAAGSSVGGSGGSSDAALLLESELRDLVSKLQQSFTQLLHPNTAIIGESVEDKTETEDEQLEDSLRDLWRIGEAPNATPPVWAVGGARASGLADERLTPISARKAVPVQKISYQQLQASAVKQAYQTAVYANSLVHHAHGLLGLVSRLKLSGILADAALDATRRERNATATPAAAPSEEHAHHPLESSIDPATIPPHLLPLHLQRTQQQLHDSGLELYAQVADIDRQIEDAEAAAATAAAVAVASSASAAVKPESAN